jgi:hypothetical protein
VLYWGSVSMPEDRLRGGKIGRRDRLYGLPGRPGFERFWQWWHKKGKHLHGGIDIQDRADAKERWDEWVQEGRPSAKLGENHG